MGTFKIDTGNAKLDSKVLEWLSWDKNEDTKSDIFNLLKEKKLEVLEKKLLQRLKFGTAGIRGKMESGYNALNDLVLIQTTQGLASYLLKTCSNIKSVGCAIGYDARHNSKNWAQRAASIMLHQGIPVYLFSEFCPTPLVPFSVVSLKCQCGIMITASHNPKDDNGYKVFWSNGPQIIHPYDQGIQSSIEDNLEPWPTSWDTEILQKSSLVRDPLPSIWISYLQHLKNSLAYPELAFNSQVKICFTPMHGVSQKFMSEAFDFCNFPAFVSVPSQKDADPDFPTVPFPNPEETGSLNEALAVAMQTECTVILANDPDADRMAVAERGKNGNWKIFTGNEIGTLLGWWMWHCYRLKHLASPSSNVYMIASAVSSKMLGAIAKKEGFNFVETLTGFKWMANKADELQREGHVVLFAFEEAIGFMCGTCPLDKDGIGACMRVTELAAFLQTENKTLESKLEELYLEYGYHTSRNSYFLCYDPPTILRIFDRLRNYDGTTKYPVTCGGYPVIHVRDLNTGYDSRQPDHRATLPLSTTSQMITFYFENGTIATLRTSGTEPKLKYYTEMCVTAPQNEWPSYDKLLQDLVNSLICEFLQPETNKLLPRSD